MIWIILPLKLEHRMHHPLPFYIEQKNFFGLHPFFGKASSILWLERTWKQERKKKFKKMKPNSSLPLPSSLIKSKKIFILRRNPRSTWKGTWASNSFSSWSDCSTSKFWYYCLSKCTKTSRRSQLPHLPWPLTQKTIACHANSDSLVNHRKNHEVHEGRAQKDPRWSDSDHNEFEYD